MEIHAFGLMHLDAFGKNTKIQKLKIHKSESGNCTNTKNGTTKMQNDKKNTNLKADDVEVMVIGQRFIKCIWDKYKN